MRTVWSLFAAGMLIAGCSGDIGDAPAGPDAGIVRGVDASTTDAAVDIDAALAVADCDATDGDVQVLDPASGHCYFWVNNPVTRLQAQAECRALGAELASIASTAENDVVASVAPDTPPDAAVLNSVDSWIGANDLVAEMVHVWDDDTPFVFDAWRDGEPNNSNANDPDGEDCVIFEGDTNFWDDRSCTLVPFRYICERAP